MLKPGMKFVFPVREEHVLWEIAEKKSGDRWLCKAVSGEFYGKMYNAHVGIEAEFSIPQLVRIFETLTVLDSLTLGKI